MTLVTLDDILDDLFLGCALEAFLAIAKATQPDARRKGYSPACLPAL